MEKKIEVSFWYGKPELAATGFQYEHPLHRREHHPCGFG
jgi:hypothetical protein